MCFALYIATDDPLPTEKWSDDRLRFYLQALSKEEESVRGKFTKAHVCYAGSWQGCGCGWFCDDEPPKTEEERLSIQRTGDCLRELHAILVAQLSAHDTAELFLCWEGSQCDPPKRSRVLTPDDFVTDSLPMEELDFVTVQKAR